MSMRMTYCWVIMIHLLLNYLYLTTLTITGTDSSVVGKMVFEFFINFGEFSFV